MNQRNYRVGREIRQTLNKREHHCDFNIIIVLGGCRVFVVRHFSAEKVAACPFEVRLHIQQLTVMVAADPIKENVTGKIFIFMLHQAVNSHILCKKSKHIKTYSNTKI